MAATELSWGKKIVWALLFGILFYIIGALITGTEIFPALAWEKILLLVGVLFGAFKDDLGL